MAFAFLRALASLPVNPLNQLMRSLLDWQQEMQMSAMAQQTSLATLLMKKIASHSQTATGLEWGWE
jgi:hypothetical protein